MKDTETKVASTILALALALAFAYLMGWLPF